MNMLNRIAYASALILGLAAFGCSDDPDNKTPDAGYDAPPVQEVNCTDYCEAVTGACTDAYAQYTNNDACLAVCQTASWQLGTANDTGGNTLGCRTYHAAAAAADPATHCGHAGSSGGNVCGSWCEVYCELALNACD